ncbi:MAG: cupredoxin domain-containing protein, partial [Pseudonocardiaceae bacterium]
MDRIATLERPPEEVSAPPPLPKRPGRFSGVAVLAAIAAAVLGISALGGAAATRLGAADLAANQNAAGQDAPAAGAEAQPGGAHSPGGHQAPAEGAAAPGGGQQPAAATHTVKMAGLQFAPQALTVAVGDTVTWVNDDTASHTVSVTDGPETFESELLAPGDSFTYTFTMPGEYQYYCAVHPDMKASVTVEGAAAPPAEGAAPPAEGAGAAPPAGGSAGCVPSTAMDAAMRHVKVAHLQASPGQQVKDLAAVHQYVKTHTVLLQDMLKPGLDGVVTDGIAKSLDVLRKHVEVAHLQTSPGQQVADLLALDQYIKTHTVLVQ